MWKALVFKELRECAPIAAAAIAAYGCILAHALGVDMVFWRAGEQKDVPFVTDSFSTEATFVSFCLAVGLAMKQTWAESTNGTWLWLLHRPVTRSQIVAVKLATGGAVYLACAGLPILLYACWAAWPRTHASPFYWSMTEGAWQPEGVIGLIYLGSFLTALRPGRWWGTRLLPLAGVAAAALLVCLLFETIAPSAMWALFALLGATVVSSILFVGRVREYS